MRSRIALSIACILPLAGKASAEMPAVDLPALIECRADPRDWGDLAFSLMDDAVATDALGWTAQASDNPLLQEYRLAAPIAVFGHETNRIALTATGPMAMLAGVDAAALSSEIGVEPLVATPEKFLGEKVVLDETDRSGDPAIQTRVSINVSTVDTHLGVTLAGCSYAITVVE